MVASARHHGTPRKGSLILSGNTGRCHNGGGILVRACRTSTSGQDNMPSIPYNEAKQNLKGRGWSLQGEGTVQVKLAGYTCGLLGE